MRKRGAFDHSPRCLCVGGMNIDILGSTDCAFVPGDSMTGLINLSPGGVARNIATQLSKLGARVELLCPLGDDAFADRLIAACEEDGIGLTHAFKTDYPTPTYLAIHDEGGEMVAAINDMRAMEALNAQALSECITGLSGADYDVGVLEANLREDSLLMSAGNLHFPLIADAVSAVKCHRLLPILPRLYAIKPNRMEAYAMTGEDSVERAAESLLLSGIAQVYISLGRDGVYARDLNQALTLPAPSVPKVSLTGAGDAMTAGLALGIAQGLSLLDTAKEGIAAAFSYLSQKLQ